MTQTLVATRPAPINRVWARDKIIAEDVAGDDLGEMLQLQGDASVWWVLGRADGDAGRELRRVSHRLELDELAIHDLLADDHRAKYEEVGHARLVLTNAVSLNPEEIDLTAYPVSLVITNRALICLVDEAKNGFHPAQLLVQKAPLLADGGLEVALQLVVGAVINTYENVIEWLEDRSDELDEAIFDSRPLTRDEQTRAFRLRTLLSQLRRMTDPMRAVMDEIVRALPEDSPAVRRWTILQQQHQRVANAADALREALSSVFDASLALADVRMNVIMKQLTGWAGILAVPTLITGFAGMNVNFPLDGTTVGFWVYLVIMLAASGLLFVIFQRKDWI